jgi:hypothetical protein
MRRLGLYRLGMFALALLVSVVSLVALPSMGRGADGLRTGEGSPDPTPQGGTGTGDPDSPSNTGRSAVRPVGPGGSVGVSVYGSQPAVVEARTSWRSPWVMRVRIGLQALRVYYLRF